MSYFETFCLLVVFGIGAKCLFNLGRFFYITLIARLLGKHLRIQDYGSWGVVTGATDGIGNAYAKQLAKTGLNVVLISRNPAKLDRAAAEIKNLYSVGVKTIPVDFTGTPAIYDKIKKELTNLDIGILVNNVGMAVGLYESLAEFRDTNGLHDMINCNVTSMVRMCHLVLPQMIKRNKGIIVNVGSILGNVPSPIALVYGATKAFVDKFSRDLAAEVRDSGIVVQTLHPGLVATKMSNVEKPSIDAPSADVYAAASFSTLGLEDRTAGYWYHKILLYFGEKATLLFRGYMEKTSKNYFENAKRKQEEPKKKKK